MTAIFDFDQGPWSAMMKRIDSFFMKCDTPKKKQRDDKQVKEDEASNSQLKDPSSVNGQATQGRTSLK